MKNPITDIMATLVSQGLTNDEIINEVGELDPEVFGEADNQEPETVEETDPEEFEK